MEFVVIRCVCGADYLPLLNRMVRHEQALVREGQTLFAILGSGYLTRLYLVLVRRHRFPVSVSIQHKTGHLCSGYTTFPDYCRRDTGRTVPCAHWSPSSCGGIYYWSYLVCGATSEITGDQVELKKGDKDKSCCGDMVGTGSG